MGINIVHKVTEAFGGALISSFAAENDSVSWRAPPNRHLGRLLQLDTRSAKDRAEG